MNGAFLGAAVSRGKDVAGSAAAGAIGAVGAELLGEYLMEDVIGRGHEPAVLREKLQQRADIAKLAATTSTLLTGHDPAIASSAAETAVRHNCIPSAITADAVEEDIKATKHVWEMATTEIPALMRFKEGGHGVIDWVHEENTSMPILGDSKAFRAVDAVKTYVLHEVWEAAAPTTGLDAGLTLPVVVGPVTKGASAAVQAGKQLVRGVERGFGRVLKVGAEAYEESQLLLCSIGTRVRALAGEAPCVSYAGEFSRATASSMARFEAKIFSKTAAPSSAAAPIPSSAPFAPPPVAPAQPLSVAALESMEVGLKVKPKPVSALELGKRYDAERRATRKGEFLESAKSTKPQAIRSPGHTAAPPPSSLAPAAPVPSAPAAPYTRAPAPVDPIPLREPAAVRPLAIEAPRMADHHIFPQQFRKFFERRNINIDEFTVSVGEVTHLKGLHGRGNAGFPGKWNKRWAAFIEEHPNASSREIFQFGGKLIDEYKLNDLSLHGYRK